MKHIVTTVLATTALVATVSTAQAQNLSYIGVIGQSASGSNELNGDDGDASAMGLEAGLIYNINSASRIVVEGQYLNWSDDGSEDLFDDAPGSEAQVALHYLRDSGAFTYGGFLQLGAAEAVKGDADELYKHYAVGLTGMYQINPAFSAYGQIGIADTFDDGNLDSFGYSSGDFARLGGIYSDLANTQLFFDVQVGSSDAYEDDDEPGAFTRIALGGETRFGAGSNWAVTYEVSQAEYDALGDPDRVEVTTLGLGMRYYFGQTQSGDFTNAGAIGTPDILSRASLFTDQLD